jgi:hypothetical protein
VILDTLEHRIEAAKKLLRVKAESMTPDELDLAAALLLRKPIRMDGGVTRCPEIPEDGTWRAFSPTRNWDDYGMLVSQTELVTGTHPVYADDSDEDVITGFRFSCHGFFSGTEVTGADLRETVCRACALLLNHELAFGTHWGHD